MENPQRPVASPHLQIPRSSIQQTRLEKLPDPTDREEPRFPADARFIPQFRGREKFRHAALFWYQFGFNVIPVCAGTKVTAVKWDKWLDALSPSSIDSYWREHPDHEVGFIVGDDYIVFDADSAKAAAALRAAEEDIGVYPTIIVQTARGEHRYFRKDRMLPCKTTSKIVGDVDDRIDIKTGRTMVILAPSTGKVLVKFGEFNMPQHASEITSAPHALISHFGALTLASTREYSPANANTPHADSLRLIEVALKRLDPDDDYETWLRLGAVVFHASGGSDEGFSVFDGWSSAGRKYEGAGDTEAKWKSYCLDHPRPATIATLRYILEARGHDWAEICDEASDQFEPDNGEGA